MAKRSKSAEQNRFMPARKARVTGPPKPMPHIGPKLSKHPSNVERVEQIGRATKTKLANVKRQGQARGR
jgi:hypothetical protein